MKHLFSMLLLVAWLPFAVSFWPLPSEQAAKQASEAWVNLVEQGKDGRRFFDKNQLEQMDKETAWLSNPKNFLQEWRVRWITNVLVFIFGLVVVALTFFRAKHWKLAVLLASSAYLLLVHSFPFQRALRWEQWQGWWMMATQYPTWGLNAAYREILFPLFHIAIIVVIAVTAAFALTRRPATTISDQETERIT